MMGNLPFELATLATGFLYEGKNVQVWNDW